METSTYERFEVKGSDTALLDFMRLLMKDKEEFFWNPMAGYLVFVLGPFSRPIHGYIEALPNTHWDIASQTPWRKPTIF